MDPFFGGIPMRAKMRMPFTRLIPTLIALVAVALPASAITWGQPDTTEHPNVGAMVVGFGGSEIYQWCSGTLIHPQVFLTAGHCTVDLFQSGVTDVFVNFDQNAFNRDTLQRVEQVVTHPNYYWGPTSNPHDVGVLILTDPADIAPANLPYQGFLNDRLDEGELRQGSTRAQFTMVGYGDTILFPPPEFQFFGQREYSVSEYRALLKSWLRMSQNQATGDGGTCYGDSGGPAFWTEPDGTETLVGVTSWGDQPCVASAFNYRVDTADTLDFIADVIEWLQPIP
jgi:secreted trypsin-like serine protease